MMDVFAMSVHQWMVKSLNICKIFLTTFTQIVGAILRKLICVKFSWYNSCMKNFFIIIAVLICIVQGVWAKQTLPEDLVQHTVIITAPKIGEFGKNYFYCTNGMKCSTEQIVREYYQNDGYQVMRAEYSFWKGIFVLVFSDEIYPYTKTQNKLFDIEKSVISTKELNRKLKKVRKSNILQFMNNQISKHEQGSYISWLDEWEIEGYKNPTEYFKSPVVQEFLSKISNKNFCKIMKYILSQENRNPVGSPDFIVWKDEEMIFVEVKRKDEILKSEQIEWGNFLIKSKIPYKIVRVLSK